MDNEAKLKSWNLRVLPLDRFPDCCLVCKHCETFDDLMKCSHPDIDWGEFVKHYSLCDSFKRIVTWEDERGI